MIKSTTKLLSICCTFRRPDMLQDMLKTHYATRSDDTEIIMYLHEDDPHLDKYKSYIGDHNHIIDRHRNMQEVINHVVFDLYPGIDYYQIICDDHLYKTPCWDKILVNRFIERSNGWGFCCGRDLINNDNWYMFQHPSAEIWSWKMAKTLGYVYPREFEHQGFDYYAKDLGLSINGLVFVPEVVIQHLWYAGCGKEPDENIKEKYSDEAYHRAATALKNWQETDKKAAIARIQKARIEEL